MRQAIATRRSTSWRATRSRNRAYSGSAAAALQRAATRSRRSLPILDAPARSWAATSTSTRSGTTTTSSPTPPARSHGGRPACRGRSPTRSTCSTAARTTSRPTSCTGTGADDAPPPVPPPRPATRRRRPGKPPGCRHGPDVLPDQEGTRTVLRIKMAPAEYYKPGLHLGLAHAPAARPGDRERHQDGGPARRSQWEIDVFGPDPRASEEAKLAAIAKIGDLAPAKRMWQRPAQARATRPRARRLAAGRAAARRGGRHAFQDWQDRTQLPARRRARPRRRPHPLLRQQHDLRRVHRRRTHQLPGVADPRHAAQGDARQRRLLHHALPERRLRRRPRLGEPVQVVGQGRRLGLLVHLRPQLLVDEPGEPDRCVAAGGPRAAYKASVQKLEITFNYDPSRRLRFYQFDPLHHDVAVFSVH